MTTKQNKTKKLAAIAIHPVISLACFFLQTLTQKKVSISYDLSNAAANVAVTN